MTPNKSCHIDDDMTVLSERCVCAYECLRVPLVDDPQRDRHGAQSGPIMYFALQKAAYSQLSGARLSPHLRSEINPPVESRPGGEDDELMKLMDLMKTGRRCGDREVHNSNMKRQQEEDRLIYTAGLLSENNYTNNDGKPEFQKCYALKYHFSTADLSSHHISELKQYSSVSTQHFLSSSHICRERHAGFSSRPELAKPARTGPFA
ncbi:hypothetical protein EYF80_006635 [Liparis tanakae]|uniref:Uncharacterized protein n=1 Tax=Liparis tanakae TaxID=230148 RepID=A0A4Z2J019_9TELE|nr:hypothetical protein EYF80_006635 [Liparis tanakae]